MKELRFAVVLEASIRHEVEHIAKQASAELQLVLDIVSRFQAEFELLLDRACSIDVSNGKYPEVPVNVLLGSDGEWQQAIKSFTLSGDKSVANLTNLWMIIALIENSRQFYQQALLNCPYPTARIFLSSLAEIKIILRRRIDGVLRGMYNEVWAQVGFAPFVIGKD
ncbi:MAG: hypothetical protein H6Q73_598 [Firmicutes bacterium]|nr:hypothetical protein [Bacillota bacterium]